MQRLVPIVFVLASLAPLRAEGDELVGSPAPPLVISKWLIAPEGETLADLRGRVVLLLPPGLVDLGDPKSVYPWSDLRAGHHQKGLRVVVLTQKAPATLHREIDVSVAVGTADAYGTARAHLIGADGKVAWSGAPREVSDAAIVGLLRKVKSFPLRRLDPSVKDAAKAFRRGRLPKAGELAGIVEHPDATYLSKRIAAITKYWNDCIERAKGISNFAECAFHMQQIEKALKGSVEGDDAAMERARLKKEMPKDISAATGYIRLRADLAKTKGKRKKIDALVKKAERFAKRYAAKVGGKRAARLAEALRADPATAEIQAFIAKERISTKSGSWRTSLPRPPQVAFDKGRSYFWHLETSHGRIRVRFYPDAAPMHVSSMLYLTELGFFDGLNFHRVIPGFMAQGGCPSGTGSGNPGYTFDGEFDAKVRHDRPGILSAANSGPGTDASQFFLTFGAASHLDGKHTVYGVVVSGLDTLKKMEKDGTSGGTPKNRITIEKATYTVE